jgi:hypothetical protein
MSEELHNNQIFSNILGNINQCHNINQIWKNKAFVKEPVVVEEPVANTECKTPIDIIKLRKKMKRFEEKTERVKQFKLQLRNNTEVIIGDNINIEDYRKPWMNLTNNQRSNRINYYLKNNTEYTETEKRKLRLLLIQGITNKLLERNSIQYNEEKAEIVNIPCVLYQRGTDNFVFI